MSSVNFLAVIQLRMVNYIWELPNFFLGGSKDVKVQVSGRHYNCTVAIEDRKQKSEDTRQKETGIVPEEPQEEPEYGIVLGFLKMYILLEQYKYCF